MTKWFQAIRQSTTYLGVAVIVIIWVGIYLLASQEHESAYQDAKRQSGNIARVLEEYIRRVVQESDSALLELRRDYLRDPQNFDLSAWVLRNKAHNELTVQFGIVNAAGFVTQSSFRSLASPVYVGDRAPFTVPRDDKTDELYISDPIVGHVTKRLTLQFVRRLSNPDGSFAGVVDSSLDIEELEKVFSSLDLGKSGVVSLVGADGILLARGGQDPASRGLAGTSIIHSLLFSHLTHSSTDTYWNNWQSRARFDGISRLLSYRKLAGMPLIAVVGLAKADIFQQADAILGKYILAGTSLTVIVLIVMIFGAAQQAHILSAAEELRRSKQSIEHSNLLLSTALKNMAHGLCMFDSEQRLVVCNERYGEMYGLGPGQVKPGAALRSILEARVRAGMSPQDTDQYIEARLGEVAKRQPYYVENVLRDGHTYAVSHRPMPDGGWVATHIDITEQRRAEQELDETRKFLVSIIENIPVSVVVKDAKTRKYLLVNRAFETMLGIPRSEMLDRTSFDIHRPKDAKSIDDADTESLQDSDHINYKEIEVNTPMRGPRMQSTRRMVIKNNRGEPKCIIAVIEDVTERKKAEQRIAFLAHHDALTGLANRAALIQKIEEAAARQRRLQEPFTVLLLDLDRFKQVNDTLGHPAGDALLIEVATRLKSLLRETDVLARLGGDEFAVIQAGESDQREAAKLLGGAYHRDVAPAVRDRRRQYQHRHQHRHRAGVRARDRLRRSVEDGGSRALSSEIGRAQRLLLLRSGDERGRERAPGNRKRSAPRHPAKRVGTALPADRRCQDAPHLQRRGAGALAPSDQGADLSGPVHSARRGDRLDHADRRLGCCVRPARRRRPGPPKSRSPSICRWCSSARRICRASSCACWPIPGCRRSDWSSKSPRRR